MTVMLVTQDGVPIDAVHLPPEGRPESGGLASGRRDLALVIAHGFTMTWQRPMVWNLVRRFYLHAGVITFDFRRHGRSGGLSTLGDKEIDDVDVAVRYAHELGYQRGVTIGFSVGGPGGLVARGAARRRGQCHLGERPRPLVLPRHDGHAPGPPGGGKAPRPGVHQARAEHPGLTGRLAHARTRAARRGGGPHLAHAGADRPR